MFRKTAYSLVLAVACATPAFAEDQSAAAQAQQQAAQAQQQAGQAAQAAQDKAAAAGSAIADDAQTAGARDQAMQDPTKMFVMDTYSENLLEVQLGQLAAQKAQDDQVKQFARMMVQDHTKANQQLKQVAQSANIQISEQLDPVHQAKLQKMQKLPASEFGRKYVNSQAAAHMMTVLEFQYQSQNAQNDQVKQFATQMLPDLQKHLQHATKLAGQMAGGAQARTASERQSDAGAAGATPAGADNAASGGTSGTSGSSAGQSSGTSGQSGQNAREAGGPGQANDEAPTRSNQ